MKKIQYVVRTCSGDKPEELQNLLNEMSMNGWDLYSINEIETDEGFDYSCIFMSEEKMADHNKNSDIVNVLSFKNQMERMMTTSLTPYELCLDLQSKINTEQLKIAKIKSELEYENPASGKRNRLNEKMSAAIKGLDELKEKLSEVTSTDGMYSKLKGEKLVINLSNELLSFVDVGCENHEDALIAEIVKLRLKLTEELGYVLPQVVFRDNPDLLENEFTINLRGYLVAKSTVYPNYRMYKKDDLKSSKNIRGAIKGVDILSGEKTLWIKNENAKDIWADGISGAQYITKVLEQIVIEHVAELIDYSAIEKYLEAVSDENPFLVENIVPDTISLSDLKYLLSNLIRERVSVKDIAYIFEKINDFSDIEDKDELLMQVRLSLCIQICEKLLYPDGVLRGINLSEKICNKVAQLFDEEIEPDNIIAIEEDFSKKLAKNIAKKLCENGLTKPIVFVPGELRQAFFSILSIYIKNVIVLSKEEISCGFLVEEVDEV